MRQVDVQRLSDSLEYGRAKYRLTRVKDPELKKRYEEIVRKYEMKYSNDMVNVLTQRKERE